MNKRNYALTMCDRCGRLTVERNGICMDCGKDHNKEPEEKPDR